MHKSPLIHSLDEYCEWMRKIGLWTNKNYIPIEKDRPKNYPIIVIAELVQDYDGKNRVHEKWVSLKDFQGE